jgi:hypothetical protein
MECLMDHIVLNVENEEKMMAFYSEVLQMPIIFETRKKTSSRRDFMRAIMVHGSVYLGHRQQKLFLYNFTNMIHLTKRVHLSQNARPFFYDARVAFNLFSMLWTLPEHVTSR